VVNGSGPSGCDDTIAVVGSKLLVFGGRIGGMTTNNMWTLDLNCRTVAYCCPEPF